jgi:hypothetical protein
MTRLCRPGINVLRTAIGVALLGAMLSACVDTLYSERRETIFPLAGDAVAANRTTQMIDPWSRASANNNIVYSGEKMQTASERYRMGKVIRPVNATTSSFTQSQAEQAASTSMSGQAPSTTTSTSSQIK